MISAMPDSPAPGHSAKAARSLRIWQPDKAGTAFAAFLLWLCIIIMIVPQGLDYNGDNGMPTSSDALNRFTWLFLLGAGIFGLAMRLKRTMVLARWLKTVNRPDLITNLHIFDLGVAALTTSSAEVR